MQNPLVIGKFGAPYGVRGWIKVFSFTQPPEKIQEYAQWQIKFKNQWLPVSIEHYKAHHQALLVKIKGFDTPEDVRRYTNCLIGVEIENLPTLPKGEYYWSQLVGLTVINLTGQVLGKINHLFATGANDVIAIKDSKKNEHLLPYISSVVKSVDLDQAQMVVDWELDADES